MKTISRTLVKGTIGTVAAGAMAMTSASPAFARDRGGDRIDAGDIIAGAVILGGIAAVAASVGNNRNDYRYRDGGYYNDRDYRGDYRQGYNAGGSPRAAIQQCVNAVERDARRAGYRFADVTEIRDVDQNRYGWKVKGRLVVDGTRGYGRYNSNYNRYDRYDRNGRYDRGYAQDSGSFKCEIDRGRVVDVDYSGIRGLR